jgi:hypothetical protein
MNTQLQKYAERLRRADRLIRQESTGTPKEFASKLNISESHLYGFLEELKLLGLPLKYSKVKLTYFYTRPAMLHIEISVEI